MSVIIRDDVDLAFLCDSIYQADELEQSHYERCLEDLRQGKRAIYGAYYQGRPAGCVMLNWYPRYKVFRKLSIPEIQDLYVLPEYRKKGIGRHLIEYCEDTCRGKDLTQVGISVGLNCSFGAAQRLYCNLGYKPDGMGITHDREPIDEKRPYFIDADLCLMMIKEL